MCEIGTNIAVMLAENSPVGVWTPSLIILITVKEILNFVEKINFREQGGIVDSDLLWKEMTKNE